MFDMLVPTVKVKASSPRGFVVINASEFDPKVHERFDEPLPPPPPPPPPPPAPVNPLANLPKDWRKSMDVAALRNLAVTASGGRTPETKEQAIQMIESALRK